MFNNRSSLAKSIIVAYSVKMPLCKISSRIKNAMVDILQKKSFFCNVTKVRNAGLPMVRSKRSKSIFANKIATPLY